MFKSKVTTLVMLASVVCYSALMAVSKGGEWLYPAIIGIVGLIVVLYVRVKKNRSEK